MSPFRFAAALMLVFGAMALVLSAVGVYGVMSYSVAQRTHEIGIRIALGAQPRDVLWLIVGQGIRTAAIGLAVGLPLAWGLSRLMASQLFGVVTLEYAILIGFVSLLAGVACLSSVIPARRAMKVDPMVALRYE
jgi:putative ABC transport system permease protein